MTPTSRREALKTLSALAAGATLPWAARAETFPARPIKLIVPHAAGGLDMVHVPYKGGAPAVQALLAGEVQLTAVSVNTALPHIQSGKVRALGLASTKRSPALPDVPTFAENGIPFEGDSWLAVVGPAGIPPDVAAKLNTEIAATLRLPDVQERLAKIGLEVVASSQADFTKVLARDVPKWGKAVKDSGAVVE